MNKILYIAIILFLGCKNNAKQVKTNTNKTVYSLEGTWQLESLSNTDVAFDSVFKERIPNITFDTAAKTFGGNSSCNYFNGKLKTDGNHIDFTIPMMMTKMYCEGDGEKVFMQILEKANTYIVDNEYLIFYSNDKELMKFTKKK